MEKKTQKKSTRVNQNDKSKEDCDRDIHNRNQLENNNEYNNDFNKLEDNGNNK